jgi:ApbE superfamily uncharacterized protein (UPF0280 family)
MYNDRTYRNLVDINNLSACRLAAKETDLLVYASKPLEAVIKESVLRHRGYIEAYIQNHPEFADTLEPWRISGPAPDIIRDMAETGKKAGVGPMAAVAGAIAERVGLDLLWHADNVVVENGGDIFLKTDTPVTIGIFAGQSPLSLQIGLRVHPDKKPVAVCTSSGTVGHSLSLGNADAVCVISDSCPLADAAATSIGNHVKSKTDIRQAIDFGKNIEDITGIVIVAGDQIGMWGNLDIVPIKRKK